VIRERSFSKRSVLIKKTLTKSNSYFLILSRPLEHFKRNKDEFEELAHARLDFHKRKRLSRLNKLQKTLQPYIKHQNAGRMINYSHDYNNNPGGPWTSTHTRGGYYGNSGNIGGRQLNMTLLNLFSSNSKSKIQTF